MLGFLANNIEQLDLALEHIVKGDVNNARFGLMLADNAVEITLHQMALDQKALLKNYAHLRENFAHVEALDAALGRDFAAKLSLARLLNKVTDAEKESFGKLHAVRNEVYHIGVRHGATLPGLARFYFHLACDVLGRYEPLWVSWSSRQKMPERAAKYLTTSLSQKAEYAQACVSLSTACNFDKADLISLLATHMTDVIEQCDRSLDFIADVRPQKIAREHLLGDLQAWHLIFSKASNPAVRQFARKHNLAAKSANEVFDFFAKNYPFPVRGDPIRSWRRRGERLRRVPDPHKALKWYFDFMSETADVRALLEEDHRQADLYVDGQIERAQFEKAMARETSNPKAGLH